VKRQNSDKGKQQSSQKNKPNNDGDNKSFPSYTAKRQHTWISIVGGGLTLCVTLQTIVTYI